jgi:hypothetical protein
MRNSDHPIWIDLFTATADYDLADELDVPVAGLAALPFKHPIAAVSFVQSVFHPRQIAGDTSLVITAAAMNEIDRNLEFHFGL